MTIRYATRLKTSTPDEQKTPPDFSSGAVVAYTRVLILPRLRQPFLQPAQEQALVLRPALG